MLLAAAHEHFSFFSDLSDDIGGEVRDWIAPLIVVAAMVVVARLLRALLRSGWLSRPGSKRIHLDQLAKPIASLIYIVGAKVFIDLAPISDRLSDGLGDVVFILGVVLVMNLARGAVAVALEASSRSLSSNTLKQGFIPLMRNLATILILLTGVVIVLKHFDYNVFSLLTALGVGSLAIGLAAQPTLSNMISGFTLIIDRNLSPGDRVTLGTFTGDVEVIGLRSTRLRTLDGNVLIVPNADMVNSKIINLGRAAIDAPITVQFRVPLAAPFERVRSTTLGILSSLAHIKTTPDREPTVQLASLAEGCQLVAVAFWVDGSAVVGSVTSEFNEKVLRGLREQGVELTGPASPTS